MSENQINKLKLEIETLKKEITSLTNKGVCKKCEKTLFFYDDRFIYIKCKHCKDITRFPFAKK